MFIWIEIFNFEALSKFQFIFHISSAIESVQLRILYYPQLQVIVFLQ
jgi:hypothetical protein